MKSMQHTARIVEQRLRKVWQVQSLIKQFDDFCRAHVEAWWKSDPYILSAPVKDLRYKNLEFARDALRQ